MPWNEADRETYAVIRARYSSDLSDEEYALIQPLLPPPGCRGRKRTDCRIILNALFYLLRAGCPWRYLPKDFPPFTTVQNRFYGWRDSGLWTQIVALLVMAARQEQGREAAPTAVVVDSQSVKTTEAGGPRGYDAGKKIKGGKRHLGVDTIGLPISLQIMPADVQDRDALAPVLKDVHAKSPFVTIAFVDGGYQVDEAQCAAFEGSRISISVVSQRISRRPLSLHSSGYNGLSLSSSRAGWLGARRFHEIRVRWRGCRLPRTASRCARMWCLGPHGKKGGNHDESYNDWRGFGKKCIPGPWGVDDGRGAVSQEGVPPDVSRFHGFAGTGRGRDGGLWRGPLLGP